MVSDVTVGTAIDQQSKTAQASTKLAADFSQFLTLLTTQLQNQDPLSPMDTTEFTNQLVAFSGVEQQINTNQKLDDLVALQLGNVMGDALGYVGMDVSYISSELSFDGTRPVKINYALNGQAVDSKLRIYDEGGKLVFETDAATSTGNNEFFWDGSLKGGGIAAPGTYEVKIDALDVDDEPVTSSTVVTGNVRGIETQNGLVFVLIGERAVSIGNILNASQPAPTAAAPEETTEESS
ncbi:MAG: flagellar hook capping family protein [Alphaproteobacteria bacterium]|nr:flagellar hook capping family protein [Alphaproteobacteria bacterium]